MSVDELVYKNFSPESYEFRINGVTYAKQSDIPEGLLIRNVNNWEVTTSTICDNLYCLSISTNDWVQEKVIRHIMKIGFSIEQVKHMMRAGISLSEIVSEAISIDSVIAAYTKLGYNKNNIHHVVYELYSNELYEELNAYILGLGTPIN